MAIYNGNVETLMSMIFQEVSHVLILSLVLYNNFPISKQNTYTIVKKRTVSGTADLYKFITFGLVTAGKKNFGCSTLNRIFLENEGSRALAGPYFEKLLVGNELTSAQAAGKMVMSNWRFYLLNDL